MTIPEARIYFENLHQTSLRRAQEALDAADNLRAYADSADIGSLTRGTTLTFAIEQENRANAALRRADAIATLLATIPEHEKENA